MLEIKYRETSPNDSHKTALIMEEYWGGEPLIVRSKNFSKKLLKIKTATDFI